MKYPQLSADFFNIHPPKAEWFKKYADLYSWSAQLLPIYEWQDCVYVGFSEESLINSNLVLPEKTVIWVSCLSENLKTTFDTLSPFLTKPEGQSKNDKVLEYDLSSGFDNAPESSSEDVKVSNSEEDGKLDLDITTPSEKTNFDFSAVTLTRTGRTSTNPEVPVTKPGIPQDALIPKQELPAAFTAAAPAKVAETLPIQKPEQKTEDSLFGTLTDTFDGVLILRKEGRHLIPWKWHQVQDPKQVVSLDKASPFRIVDRTQKSFHGYLTLNATIETSLKKWYNGHIPEHVTISPVIVKEEVVAMFCGMGSHNLYDKKTLQACEEWSKKFAEKIISQPDLIKAA